MTRTHPLDPVIPALTLGRVTSGAFAGLIGGLFFGVLMLTDYVASGTLEDRGMLAPVSEVLGTTDAAVVWLVHALVSLAMGIVFSLAIAAHSYRSSLLWALGYGVLLWGVGGVYLLRTLTDQPIGFDSAAAFSLIGHLLYGLGLGLFYVGFHNLEIREALDAESEKWRAWGKRERES